jgi:hypothetical protein
MEAPIVSPVVQNNKFVDWSCKCNEGFGREITAALKNKHLPKK